MGLGLLLADSKRLKRDELPCNGPAFMRNLLFFFFFFFFPLLLVTGDEETNSTQSLCILSRSVLCFYSASAMLSAVLAIVNLSVRLTDRLTV